MNFKALHQQDKPLLLCNVWDVSSAKVAEKLGFQAIGTSSAALSNTLGYEDGENLSFKTLAMVTERIKACTNIPLTVDVEAGYSKNVDEIVENLITLIDMGVVGVNIEDSVADKVRELVPAETFAKKLTAIKNGLEKAGRTLFINVRTDAFLLKQANAIDVTNNRAKWYAEAGADGLFVPCITQPEDIQAVVSNTQLPVNVMLMPNLPDMATLTTLGVKRVSMGNFLFESQQRHLQQQLEAMMAKGSFEMIF